MSDAVYVYDANGNMTCREENGQAWIHTYNDENRLSVVEKIAGTCASPGATSETMTFTYDGAGVRVMQVYDDGINLDVTTLYFAGVHIKYKIRAAQVRR